MSEISQNRHYAGFWLRLLAYWVDYLIIFPISLMFQYLLGNNPLAVFQATSLEEITKLQQSSLGSSTTMLSLIFGIGYFLIFWVHYDGATPGKKLLGIKIEKDTGEKVTYPVAFIRYIGSILSAITVFFFGIGYLWIIWDKKKQSLHDKIAGTIVVKTEKKPQLALAIFLSIISIAVLITYMSAAVFKGVQLGLKDVQSKKNVTQAIAEKKLQENQKKDQASILSYAPSSCGLTIPIPKTTDIVDGKERKWLFEEVSLSPSGFFVLDKDVYETKELQGVFIGYKDATARLGGESFSVAYPGLNIYCVDNTKGLSLDEYTSLALANKNYKVTLQKKTYWGEVPLVGATLEGKDQTGKQIRDYGYLGLTQDGTKLLYIRVWSAEEKDTNKEAIDTALNIIIRNLSYRGSDTTSLGDPYGNVNKNVKGASTTLERSAK